jgi:methylenetetrahydrofolate dehydrogenase (NADP+) / methenyltetrahydrofolate cyclohydrolase
MTAILLTGHAIAQAKLADVRASADHFGGRFGRAPSLALLAVGDNIGARAYTARLQALADQAGVALRAVRLTPDCDEAGIAAALTALNEDPATDAILPLLPFAPHIRPTLLAEALAPGKDIDGLSAGQCGRWNAGLEARAACAPQAAMALAASVVDSFKGRTVTVVGASRALGQPLALMLLRAEATVTIAHAATRDLAAACQSAEILFVAAGRAGLIGAAHVKPGAVVIDLGVHEVATDGASGARFVGDVDAPAIAALARAVSAVPDGVGPITSAFALENTVRAAFARMQALR